jgi:hypothetical protein
MRRVIIRDGTEPSGSGGREFDLRDILEALGPRAASCDWSCDGLQYCSTDETDVPSLDLAASGRRVPGAELCAELPRIRQVIDGEVRGFDEGALWVVVRAVESSWWEVLSDDPSVFAAIAARFRVVEDAPSDAV